MLLSACFVFFLLNRCYAALGRLSHGQRLRLATDAGGAATQFQLRPRQFGAPVFDFEPEPLVTVAGGELKTVAALTAFLADLYMAGRITATGVRGGGEVGSWWRCLATVILLSSVGVALTFWVVGGDCFF